MTTTGVPDARVEGSPQVRLHPASPEGGGAQAQRPVVPAADGHAAGRRAAVDRRLLPEPGGVPDPWHPRLEPGDRLRRHARRLRHDDPLALTTRVPPERARTD